MHPVKYSLKWQTYSDHLKSMLKELMFNEDFSDVTLVTEDKKQIKAHIVKPGPHTPKPQTQIPNTKGPWADTKILWATTPPPPPPPHT